MWPFRKRPPEPKPLIADKRDEAEAHKALELSQKALDRTLNRGPEVAHVASTLRQLHDVEDRFALLIEESMKPRKRRWRLH
jgi:hypothetical protein